MFSDLLKWPKKNQAFCPNYMENGKVETLRKCQELCLNQNNCIGVHFVLGFHCDSCVDDVQQHGEAYDDIYLMTGNIVNFTKYVRYFIEIKRIISIMIKVTQAKSFVYAEQEYYRGFRAENCFVNEETIANLEDCQNAITRLGLSFGGSSSWNDRPAGCFYGDCNTCENHENGKHCHTGKDCKGFFNTITDPNKTNKPKPRDFSRHLGAICNRGIRKFINY